MPGTGRERNIVHDAGDTLECLQRADVHLVLSGHKHVPYAWRLENLFVVNAGTVSTTRLRGKTKPCYNVIEARPERVTVFRKYPFHEQDAILSFDPRTYEYEKDQSLLGETATAERRPARMHAVPVIALIDGEHHPSAVRDALAGLDLAGVVFCGGEEKLGPGSLEEHYGMPVETEVEEALRRLAPRADAVVDLADEPVVPRLAQAAAGRARAQPRARLRGARAAARAARATSRSTSTGRSSR